MAIEGISNRMAAMPRAGESVPTNTDNASMSVSDFYKLLAAQMQYQDADNPMDTSEMMASMVQTQMIEAITQMTSMNMTTYASSMMGKNVTVALMDKNGMYTGDKTGTVTGIVLGDNPLLFIGKDAYYLSQVVAIGDIPEEEETQKPDGGNGDNDTQKPVDPPEGSGDKK